MASTLLQPPLTPMSNCSTIEEADLESVLSGGSCGTQTEDDDDRHGTNIYEDEESHEIGRKETRLVNYSKVMVVVVILIVAAAMGFLTYNYVSNQEHKDYKKQFDNVATDVISASKLRGNAIFDNLESVSVQLTSYALANDSATWPFVVFPHFQVIGMVSNALTGASTLSISPIVMDYQRAEWENFTARTAMDWMTEGHMYDQQANPELYQEKRYRDQNSTSSGPPIPPWNVTGIFPFIYDLKPPSFRPSPREEAPFYVVSWQTAPAPDRSPLVNFDTNYQGNSPLFNRAVIRHKKPVLSAFTSSTYLKFSYDRRFEDEETVEPHSFVYYPVFDNLKTDRKVVAILNAFIRWSEFLKNTLPPGEKPIFVVLESTCQQSISLELRGDRAFFVGEGDLHNTRYDGLKKTSEFAAAATTTLNEEVDGLSCACSMSVYPTDEWSEDYFTSEPITYACAVVSCFLFTTLVFVFYDYLHERRNRVVVKSATQTQRIVSDLFPSNVRERLMAETKPEESETRKSLSSWLSESPKMAAMADDSQSLKDFSSHSLNCVTASAKIFGSQPIADLFPDTTIMFADMVGFTKWSSTREPTQVFMLLELVYHSFDEIAKRRRVFKVETVGDCYVACAGLPTPRKDHALVMAKFSMDCMKKMSAIASSNTSVFGNDTADLCMRCGLHSGPVTAGILRGIKGRFQLFGDTMNTASRMETNGAPNRIHISQETCNLLVASGKFKWIVPREDKIQVKGKGELQTYWLKGLDTESHALSLADTHSSTASLNELELENLTVPDCDVEV